MKANFFFFVHKSDYRKINKSMKTIDFRMQINLMILFSNPNTHLPNAMIPGVEKKLTKLVL